MQKIESLTPEQEALIPSYVEKWIRIGTDTKNESSKVVLEIVKDFRKLISLNADVPLVMAKNPLESWIKCCLWEMGVTLEDLEKETQKVFDRTSDYSIPQASLPYNTNLLSYVFSFYDYMFSAVGVEIDKKLRKKYDTWERTSKLFAIYPLEKLTVVCEKPTAVKLNQDNLLHCDGGPALAFDGPGDFRIYALNGVKVSEYLAVTPAEELDLQEYMKERNADVKAEFLRKAGVEKFLELGKLKDTYKNYSKDAHPFWHESEYELWDMTALFPSIQDVRYIKMRNFTTGVTHMEAIAPGVETLEEAMQARFNGKKLRIIAAA